MIKKLTGLALFTLMLVCAAMSQDLCQPVGWATQNGGVTGGGNATPVIVNSYSALDAAIDDESVKVIHVSGTINIPSGGRIVFQDQSDKSIFGLPGAKLVSNDLTSGGSGIMQMKRCDNIIIRNIIFEGPGAYDVDGNDNLTIEDSRNIWIDHCEFHDGTDGNFDIKSEADLISVTWCTFSYEKPPIPDGPGGSDDHRYSNLFGSSDGATGDRGKLRITMQYCWWGEGVRERMPRVRYGKVHMVNNLFNSDVSNHCIRAGYEADIRVEGNYFDDQNEPIDLFKGDYTAVVAFNNVGQSDLNNGSGFTPPYSINVANPNDIVTPIMNCAGATLDGPNGCSTCQSGNFNNPPSISITSPSNGQTFSSPSTITINANASDSDGEITQVEFFSDGNSLGIDYSSPYSLNWNNVTDGTYSLTAVATDNDGATSTSSGVEIIVGDGGSTGLPAELVKHGSGSSSQTINLGQAIDGYYYDWFNANTVVVTGMPDGINIDIDNNAQSVTFSGTPTEAGVFNYTITTVGGDPEATKSATLTVNGPSNQAPQVNISAPSNNSTFNEGGDITITVSASDNDGNVVSVEFYEGSNLLGTDNSFPYSFDWNNVQSGSYSITAVAIDNDGASSTSTAISISVNDPAAPDCNGDIGGSAYIDACGSCVGGNTGQAACTPNCSQVGVQFGMVGYATLGGGTTGGAGGDEVTVNTGNDLQDAINEATGPRIIYVDGTITPANSSGLSKIDIKDVSDISIIGLTGADFDGIGLKVWRAHNIIIQNITVHHVLIGDKDGLNIEGPSSRIWVDHCEFYNEFQGVGKDYYDALLDLKRDVDHVTISWCYFHDSWKCSLAGSSESDTYNRTVTYHHNFYENINSRLPLFRSGYGHMFNNYYKDIASTTINSRINACVKIENNYFLNAQNPYVSAYSDVVGYGDIVGNELVNSPFVYSSDVQELTACSASIPYNYENYLNCASDVPSIVQQYSGVDKTLTNQLPSVSITAPSDQSSFDSGTQITVSANASDPDGSIAQVEFFEGNNSIGVDNSSSYSISWLPSSPGTYTITAVATDNEGGTSTSSAITIIVNEENQDCNGDAHGSASIDDCGVCSGGNTGILPNSTCSDCNGDVNGTASVDDCSVCSGGNTGITPNSTCTDCNGDVNGTASLDACGRCTGGNTGALACSGAIQGEDACDYLGQVESDNTGYFGDGYLNTDNVIDAHALYSLDVNQSGFHELLFRFANGGSSNRTADLYINNSFVQSVDFVPTGSWESWDNAIMNLNFDNGLNTIELRATTNEGLPNVDQIGHHGQIALGACEQDCNGEWGGTAYYDNCGTCVAGNTGNVACTQDCNGDWGGSAYLDNCGTCVAGNTGNTACEQDCNGDWGGSAYLDNCGTCVEGNTGNAACSQDCNGDWGGTAYYDNCGTCVAGNTGNTACEQDCNGDFGGTASIDQCGVCSGGNTGITPNSTCLDCNGDINGTAFIDGCNQCVGGNTGEVACDQDCNGDFGGTASIDQCGVCSGGNTGVTPNESCTDCNGDINGDANIDVCGNCSGGNTGVTPTTDIDECVTSVANAQVTEVTIHPNPTEGEVFLNFKAEWSLYTMTGIQIKSGFGAIIDFSPLPSGVYLIRAEGQVLRITRL